MFKNLSIRTKLLIGFLVAACAVGLNGVIGAMKIDDVNESAAVIYRQKYPIVEAGLKAEAALAGQLDGLHAYLAGARSGKAKYRDASAQFAKWAGALDKVQVTASEAASQASIRQKQKTFDEAALKAMAAKEAADEARSQSAAAARNLDQAFKPFLAKLAGDETLAERISDVMQEVLAPRDYVLGEGAAGPKEAFAMIKAKIQAWPDYAKLRAEHEALVAAAQNAFAAYDRAKAAEKTMAASLDACDRAAAELNTEVKSAQDAAHQLMGRAMEDADRTASDSRRALLGVTAAAFLFAALSGLAIARSITNPLALAVAAARRIASGDLMVEVNADDRRDEAGQLLRSLQTMTESLREQIRSISEGANVLASTASQISAATAQTAASAAETATSVSETTATVEEVRQTVQVSTEKARFVSETAQQAAQTSETGQKAVSDTIAGMNRIREQMETIGERIASLSEQSQAIGDIIATVEDLAEQSNLLAVNASIEAAKAGEYGRGFAVVAQEVRNLAEQSKQATARVGGILNDIQKATGAAVMAAEEGAKAVHNGVAQAEQSGEAIQALARAIAHAAQAAAQIAASSQQQLVGMDQTAEAMHNIEQASAQNVESSKQLESAAENLNRLGQRLMELVQQYKV